MKLPNKVKELRVERGLSQEELAKLAGIKSGKSYISRLENCEPVVSLRVVHTISKSLKANPTDIFLFNKLYS